MEESPALGKARPRGRLRVTMVIQRFRPYFSGQGVQLEQLSRALSRRGVDVTVLTAIRNADAPREEAADGYRVRRLRCDLVGNAALRRRLWSPTFALRAATDLWSRRREIDLVHVHGVNDALYAAWAFARARRLPVVFELTLMGADDPAAVRDSRNHFSAVREALYRRMDGYVAISPQLADAAREGGVPRERLRTIPQGVDLERYRPGTDRMALRRALGLDGDGPVVAFLGSLVERKGIDLLLAAWARIHARQPSAHLVLVGRDRFEDDATADAFLRRAFEVLPASASRSVTRVGVRHDAERFLQAADVFLFPSRREGFGTAIIEAMACGLPCVVAELPGITDFIFSGSSQAAGGIVVRQEDAVALADAALELLANPERARALGAAARARAAERFAIDAVADQYLSLYAALLDPPPPQGAAS
jgi:glycosyltransferase involved in cell wall biosynthesis